MSQSVKFQNADVQKTADKESRDEKKNKCKKYDGKYLAWGFTQTCDGATRPQCQQVVAMCLAFFKQKLQKQLQNTFLDNFHWIAKTGKPHNLGDTLSSKGGTG